MRVVDRSFVFVRYLVVQKLINEGRFADPGETQNDHFDWFSAVGGLPVSAAPVNAFTFLILTEKKIFRIIYYYFKDYFKEIFYCNT